MIGLARLMQTALLCVAVWGIVTAWKHPGRLTVRARMRQDFIFAALWGSMAISDYFSEDYRLWVVICEAALALLYVAFTFFYHYGEDDEADLDE